MKVTASKSNTFTGHRDCVYALAGTNGQEFFSSGGDGMVVRWDLEDPDQGDLVAQVPASVYALKYLEAHRALLVGQNFEGLQWIDLEQKSIERSLKIEDSAIFAIQSYQDHLILALGTGLVMVLSQPDLVPLRRLAYAQHSARTIALHPSQPLMAIGYSDHKIRVFDLDQYSLVKEFKAHDNSVFALAFSPDGQLLLSGGRDAHLKAWDTEKFELQESIVAHMFALNDIAFSPSGKHFVTCSMDKSLKVWDYSLLKLIKVIDKSRHAGHGTSVNKVFWSPYNDEILSCSDDRTISLWNLEFS